MGALGVILNKIDDSSRENGRNECCDQMKGAGGDARGSAEGG